MEEPEVRVGDAERRVVDERLMAAVGDGVLTLLEYDERAGRLWESRTRGQLEALVADLPPVTGHPRAATLTPYGAPDRRVIAVLSEDRLAGQVAVGQAVRGYAVLGKAVVDLRREDLPDGVRVSVRAVLGEVEVQLPPGSRVAMTGVSVLGERKLRVAAGRGPVVHLDAIAVLGGVTVTVGDGAVVPAASADRTGLAVGGPHRAAAPALPQRQPARQRLVQRVRNAGLAGVLLLGAAGVVASGTDRRVVFGSGTVQVREDAVEEQEVQVSLLFGSVKVVVPDDAEVQIGGLVVFGSTECDDACDGKGTGPVVRVRGIGGFGSLEVVTQSEMDERPGAGAGRP